MTDIVCVDTSGLGFSGTIDVPNLDVDINLLEGQVIGCTFTDVAKVIDLELTKSLVPLAPPVVVGSTIEFTLTVTNNNAVLAPPNDGLVSDTATDITVEDVIPNGYTYEASSIAGGDTRNVDGTTLTWGINALNPGQSAILTFRATVNAL